MTDAEPILSLHVSAVEALATMRQTLGERHPETLKSMGNLSDLMREQGRLDEVAALCRM